MGRRPTLILIWLVVALSMAGSPLASFAEPEPLGYRSAAELNPPPGLAQSSGQVTALIELADPPIAAGGASGQQAQRIAAAQNNLMRDLAGTEAQVLYQARFAANGIAVSVPVSQVDRLMQLPGVARVSIIPPKLPATASESIDAPALALASVVAGATGLGVRVGLIDRGIDYTHADFGGPGTPAAYASNDPTKIEPGTFPTAKVAGGYDFAGDGYDASAATPNRQPDPDPLECNRQIGGAANPYLGQGTHDAGLVAGMGVDASGATYRGPYGPATDYGTFQIPPGIAPEAQLYAYKVFGCSGSTTLLTAAIDRALDPNGDGNGSDRLDVLLITLGTPFGSADDPDAQAVDRAVRAGIVVVVAAGDSLNTFYSVSSPASARLAIAVGASDGQGKIAAISARGPLRGNALLKPDMVAPGVAVLSANVGSGAGSKAMTGTAAAAAQVAGGAALLRQRNPGWSPAQTKAALMNAASPIAAPPSLAGAGELNVANLPLSGVLAYSSAGGGLTFGAPWIAASTSTTRTLLIENTSGSDQLVTLSATAIATEPGVTLNLPTTPIVVPAHGTAQANVELAIDASGLDFTADPATEAWQNSRPRHYLAEHGGYIRLRSADINETRVRPGHAAHFDSVDFYLDDRLLDASLDSREVQDYVATTPGRHVVNLRRTGASASSPPIFSAPVDLAAGRDYSLLVIGRPGALAILPVDDTVSTSPPAGQALIHYVNANRVEPNWNIGPLDVYLDGVLRVAALAVGQSSPYVPIAPGQHLVEFFKTGDVPGGGHREAHKTFVVAAGEAILLGTGRHDDDDGDLTDTEQRAFVGQAPARIPGVLLASVPFSALPYLAADAHLTGPVVVPAGAQTFAATVRNSGARNAGLNGLLPTVRTPLASAFELAARSPAISGLSAGLRSADVQYLGITSNYPSTPNLATASLYFGFSTYAPWSTPNEVQFLVYIDSNRDGTDDYALASTNWGTATGGAATDVPISSLYPVRAGGALGAGVPYSYWGAFPSPVAGGGVNITPFNTAVGYQQVGLSDLGMPLDPARPNGPKGPPPAKFCYHVETRARDRAFFGEVVDRVPDAAAPAIAACNNRAGVLLYDVQNYAIAPINTANLVFGQGSAARPVFVDIDGGQISGGVNPAVLAARGAELLVLHHQNAPYPQAEVVGVSR